MTCDLPQVLACFSIAAATLQGIGVGGEGGVRDAMQRFRREGEMWRRVTRDV